MYTPPDVLAACAPLAALALLGAPRTAAAAEDDLLIELHYKPVANAQIAIWLEDRDGKHVQDLLVTQATGKLGIGNRPGIWNFVGSWRAPYGPRTSVLPIWAHRRAHPYPRSSSTTTTPATRSRSAGTRTPAPPRTTTAARSPRTSRTSSPSTR
jgi:hypothetical protein